MGAWSCQLKLEYFILSTLYMQCTGTHSQEVSDHSAVSGPNFLGNVIFCDVAQGTELCPLVLFETWTWPTETVQVGGTKNLYCDQRKAVHCPSAVPWVVILNANCYKLWAITSLVSWIYYQQSALPIDLKVVLLCIIMMWSHFSRLELLLITSFNNITASWPSWLWNGCWCKSRYGSWKLVVTFCGVCSPLKSLLLLETYFRYMKAIPLFDSLGSCRIETNGLVFFVWLVFFVHLSCIFALVRIFLSGFLDVSLQISYTGLCCLCWWKTLSLTAFLFGVGLTFS